MHPHHVAGRGPTTDINLHVHGQPLYPSKQPSLGCPDYARPQPAMLAQCRESIILKEWLDGSRLLRVATSRGSSKVCQDVSRLPPHCLSPGSAQADTNACMWHLQSLLAAWSMREHTLMVLKLYSGMQAGTRAAAELSGQALA